MNEQLFLGQVLPITPWGRCAEKPVVGGRLVESAVQGRIIEATEVDRMKSVMAGEEILKKVLCFEEKVDGSNDVTVRPMKSHNIADFKNRFPTCFDAYRKLRGTDVHIKQTVSMLMPELPKELASQVSAEAQIAHLRRLLAQLEADGTDVVDPAANAMPEGDIEDARIVPDGTPLSHIKDMPPKVRRGLEHSGIGTCEILAGMGDDHIATLGPSGLKWREAAKIAAATAKEDRINTAVARSAAA